jgi:hypothetical protein
MDGQITTREQIEDALLQVTERIQEELEERHIVGEVRSDELKEIYRLISDWTQTAQKLLNIVP